MYLRCCRCCFCRYCHSNPSTMSKPKRTAAYYDYSSDYSTPAKHSPANRRPICCATEDSHRTVDRCADSGQCSVFAIGRQTMCYSHRKPCDCVVNVCAWFTSSKDVDNWSLSDVIAAVTSLWLSCCDVCFCVCVCINSHIALTLLRFDWMLERKTCDRRRKKLRMRVNVISKWKNRQSNQL